MAEAIIRVPGLESGRTDLFARLVDQLTDVIRSVEDGGDLTEKPNAEGDYTFSTISGATGLHAVIIYQDGDPIPLGRFWVTLTDTATEHIATDCIVDQTIVISGGSPALQGVLDNGDLQIYRGDFTVISRTIGNIVGRTGEKVFFTIKETKDPPDLTDTTAIIQITETTGAVKLNGANYATASDASIVVNDATTGEILITIKSAMTNQLAIAEQLYYDIQWINAAGEPITKEVGRINIVSDVTRRKTIV